MIHRQTITVSCLAVCLCLLIQMTGCSSRSDQTPAEIRLISVGNEVIEMVEVAGGTFWMGCTKEQGNDCEEGERPAHEEVVDTFYLGKYEVTHRLWKAVIGTYHPSFAQAASEDCPVNHVSWKDAQFFMDRLKIQTGCYFRLPTEAEWEYAARGGNRSKGYKYSGSNRLDEVGWYEENMADKVGPQPVGLKKPNELGIYDMSGNVWEWCEDVYQNDYIQHGKRISSDWPFPGVQLHFRRIIRGGSWGGTAFGCRVSYVDYDTDGYRDEYGGFRLALDKDSIHN